MQWITAKHIDSRIEVSESGVVRDRNSNEEYTPFYSSISGFYVVDIMVTGNTKVSRINIHEIVARYFLNNGEKISKHTKVVFKNGDLSDVSVRNLEIVNKNQQVVFRSAKKENELYVSYGDEIYC